MSNQHILNVKVLQRLNSVQMIESSTNNFTLINDRLRYRVYITEIICLTFSLTSKEYVWFHLLRVLSEKEGTNVRI